MDDSMNFSRTISLLLISLFLLSLTSCTTAEQRNKDVLATASHVEHLADSKIICDEDMDFDLKVCSNEGNITVVAKNTGREVIYGFDINDVRKDLLLRSGMSESFTIQTDNTEYVKIVSIIKVNGEMVACEWDTFETDVISC